MQGLHPAESDRLLTRHARIFVPAGVAILRVTVRAVGIDDLRQQVHHTLERNVGTGSGWWVGVHGTLPRTRRNWGRAGCRGRYRLDWMNAKTDSAAGRFIFGAAASSSMLAFRIPSIEPKWRRSALRRVGPIPGIVSSELRVAFLL